MDTRSDIQFYKDHLIKVVLKALGFKVNLKAIEIIAKHHSQYAEYLKNAKKT